MYAKLRPGVSPADFTSLSWSRRIHWKPFAVPGWVRLQVSASASSDLQAELSRDARVLAVEVERRLHAAMVPNDPHWGSQWGPAKVNAPLAWDATTGSDDLVVAVLDSGVDVDHPDLVGQLWVNAGEIAGNGLDDDGNGKIDDINGWRFYHRSDNTPAEDNDIDDQYRHGTHVSGIVAAAGNNGVGVAGMAWGCRLMTVRVLDAVGRGWYSDVAAGIVYAVDNGARIINLSLGGSEGDDMLGDAVAYADAHGVLVVAAAGNIEYGAYEVLYPAAYDAAVAVAATTSTDTRAYFSRYGPQVDIAAPGSTIYSTHVGGGYRYDSGTSMATPHVSGLAALIWSYQPTLPITDVKQLMVDTAVDINVPGWDQYTGWGRIDAAGIFSTARHTQLYMPLVQRRNDPSKIWPWGR
jgi:subtilisin family serine protease